MPNLFYFYLLIVDTADDITTLAKPFGSVVEVTIHVSTLQINYLDIRVL